ncbi:hypothetical protein RI367_007025 [Sorochytrium milnesiophthora]
MRLGAATGDRITTKITLARMLTDARLARCAPPRLPDGREPWTYLSTRGSSIVDHICARDAHTTPAQVLDTTTFTDHRLVMTDVACDQRLPPLPPRRRALNCARLKDEHISQALADTVEIRMQPVWPVLAQLNDPAAHGTKAQSQVAMDAAWAAVRAALVESAVQTLGWHEHREQTPVWLNLPVYREARAARTRALQLWLDTPAGHPLKHALEQKMRVRQRRAQTILRNAFNRYRQEQWEAWTVLPAHEMQSSMSRRYRRRQDCAGTTNMP